MDRKGIDSTFLDESSYLFYVIVQRLPEKPGYKGGQLPSKSFDTKISKTRVFNNKKNHTPTQIIYSKELNIGTLVLMQ